MLLLLAIIVLADAASIQEIAVLDFALMLIPRFGSEFITVPANGGAASGTGSIASGAPRPGSYTIRGDSDFGTFTLDIQNINSNSSDITISDFTGLYGIQSINSFPKGGLPVSMSSKTLSLGARITYTSRLSEGSYAPSFDIVYTVE
jgi:hypothetical protein